MAGSSGDVDREGGSAERAGLGAFAAAASAGNVQTAGPTGAGVPPAAFAFAFRASSQAWCIRPSVIHREDEPDSLGSRSTLQEF
jgi:hypothetical protein